MSCRGEVIANVRHDTTVKVEAMSELLETAFLIILVLVTCFFIYTIVTSYYYQCLLGRQLEEELGFKDGAAYIRVGRRTHSAVCLNDITPDGVFHRAGVRTGIVERPLTWLLSMAVRGRHFMNGTNEPSEFWSQHKVNNRIGEQKDAAELPNRCAHIGESAPATC